MIWVSIFFFFSGLCSLVYELVWLRLAMAKFGVNTALVSIVLSVFMAGLGAGSWLAGAWVRRHGHRIKIAPLRLYAMCELIIGISALVVPLELTWGSRLLESIAGQSSISSGIYYLLSGSWLALTLIPWCACMGATIPIAMFAIRSVPKWESRRSFSFLYLANVLGAVAGASITPALIELYGFHGTLRVGALLNLLIFASAMILTLGSTAVVASATSSQATPSGPVENDRAILVLLFTTGLATMGMEVIWIRLYTYFVGPVVYSFAKILASYLLATFLGSQVYRMWSRRERGHENRLLWISLALAGLLPLLTADSRVDLSAGLRVFIGVFPFAAIIGFLTPMLVDRWAAGDPDRAGRAYAVNVLGCIVGPLLSGFVLLPLVGERISMLLFVAPWFAMAMMRDKKAKEEKLWQTATAGGLVIAALTVFFFTRDYENFYRDGIIVRDSTATVIAAGSGMSKRLLVNGIGMTVLTPVTKMMAHFTLSHLSEPPKNVLVICFGMGTTFRSVMSWGVPVTVVELVPSVPSLFTYYHSDGAALRASPKAHIVIDDGRRFLDRSAEKFDAVIIDPPPPVEAAGSSLLYSREFYVQVKEHLRPGGILQQWMYLGDDADRASVARALMDVFPYVKVWDSMFGRDGIHYLASDQPIPDRTAKELLARMPQSAITDMMEWGPARTPEDQFNLVLFHETSPEKLIARSPNFPALDDDRPINEYYLLRDMFPDEWNEKPAGSDAQAKK